MLHLSSSLILFNPRILTGLLSPHPLTHGPSIRSTGHAGSNVVTFGFGGREVATNLRLYRLFAKNTGKRLFQVQQNHTLQLYLLSLLLLFLTSWFRCQTLVCVPPVEKHWYKLALVVALSPALTAFFS